MAKNIAQISGKSVRGNAHQMVQDEPNQVKNNAGGFVYQVSDINRLRRFLTLGTTNGSYYVTERKLSRNNADFLISFLGKDHVAVIDEVVKMSHEGRIAKNDTAIFVLALAAVHENEAVRKYALAHLNAVCRIGTHLFTFASFVKEMKVGTGWGRGLRKAFANWYNDKSASSVAYQICKYQSRSVEGELPWSHRDILRKAHVTPATKAHDLAFCYATKGVEGFDKSFDNLNDYEDLRYIYGHELIKGAENAKIAISIIKEYKLSRESIPTQFMKEKAVLDELVNHMPMTATIRSLGPLTAAGTLVSMGDKTRLVVDRLTDEENLKTARVHPIALLAALRTYEKGHGFRGNLSWNPISQVKDALEDAFYKSFNYVESTGANYMLGIDVSGSMTWSDICGIPNLLPSEGAAAMAMTIARSEKNYEIRGFCHELVDLKITARDSLNSALNKTRNLSFGGTDCALPMIWAQKNKVPVDAFVVITDNETWRGDVKPAKALRNYRQAMGIGSKLIVIGMTATEFTVADPNDGGMVDIAGFDANCPRIISDFVQGNL